jgi:Pyruvate/2-oxoacid:ferredoxin oxidoreductase delta subunit
VIRGRIERARCVTCRRCVAVCPEGAITVDGDACVVDQGRCVGCGSCAKVCRTDAVRLVEAVAP